MAALKSAVYSITVIAWVLVSLSVVSLTDGAKYVPCFFETCKCIQSDTNTLYVNCQNMYKADAKANYFPKRTQTTINLPISDFVIQNYNFQQIPDNVFEGLSIERMLLVNNDLQKLTAKSLKGIKGLTSFYIKEEDKFTTIETGTLDSLIGSLSADLEFSYIKLDDTKLAVISAEINKAKNIRTLYLKGNQITRLTSNHLKGLSSLESFYIDNNKLVKIDSDAFSANPSLKELYASSNSLSDLKEVFKALANKQITSIDLSNNQITSLTTETQLPKLDTLVLSNNQITSFNLQSLVGVNLLSELDLSSNKLNLVDDERLNALTYLYNLNLANNYLAKVPSIRKNKVLYSLDLSNQNGKLTSIPDYAFERESPINNIQLLLDGNNIVSFGAKAFCSRSSTSSSIAYVTFSYKTMKAIPKCVLKQLSAAEINVPWESELGSDYSDVCNCDLYLFAKRNNLNISGVCQSVFPVLNCNENAYQDPCVNQAQYKCAA